MRIPTMAQPTRPRIVPRSRAEQIRRVNVGDSWYKDLYHRALMLHWWLFLILGCIVYLAVNLVFAGLYFLQPGSITGARPGSFGDAFFFSIQTIATIGYGQMSPATLFCNILVTIETMTGLVFLALATGVTFARISRPTARVMFADHVVIGPQNGVPTLSVRIANARLSQILEADVAVALLRYEMTAEGVRFRRFYDLPLLRRHTPVFAMTFNIMHTIDATSPLHGQTGESLIAEDVELLITVTGLEEITSQTVHARHSYTAAEFRFDRRFADVIRQDDHGIMIDYGRFHDTEPTA